MTRHFHKNQQKMHIFAQCVVQIFAGLEVIGAHRALLSYVAGELDAWNVQGISQSGYERFFRAHDQNMKKRQSHKSLLFFNFDQDFYYPPGPSLSPFKLMNLFHPTIGSIPCPDPIYEAILWFRLNVSSDFALLLKNASRWEDSDALIERLFGWHFVEI